MRIRARLVMQGFEIYPKDLPGKFATRDESRDCMTLILISDSLPLEFFSVKVYGSTLTAIRCFNCDALSSVLICTHRLILCSYQRLINVSIDIYSVRFEFQI